MHVQPPPADPFRAAQVRAAVELEIPVVCGVVVFESTAQIVLHRERMAEILEGQE